MLYLKYCYEAVSDPDSHPHLISILPLFIGSYAMQATQQFLFDSRETLNFYLTLKDHDPAFGRKL